MDLARQRFSDYGINFPESGVSVRTSPESG